MISEIETTRAGRFPPPHRRPRRRHRSTCQHGATAFGRVRGRAPSIHCERLARSRPAPTLSARKDRLSRRDSQGTSMQESVKSRRRHGQRGRRHRRHRRQGRGELHQLHRHRRIRDHDAPGAPARSWNWMRRTSPRAESDDVATPAPTSVKPITAVKPETVDTPDTDAD